jgi:hypothetical protein
MSYPYLAGLGEIAVGIGYTLVVLVMIVVVCVAVAKLFARRPRSTPHGPGAVGAGAEELDPDDGTPH